MKQMKLRSVLALAAILVCGDMMLTSCKHDMSDYMPKPYSVTDAERLAYAEKVLGVKIDPQQDWALSQQYSVKVNVDADLENISQVAVLDGNPIVGVTNLLTSTAATNNSTVTLSFRAPATADIFYVACINNEGECITRPFLPGEDTSVSFDDAAENAPSASPRRAAVSYDYIIDNNNLRYTDFIVKDFYSFRSAVLEAVPEGEDNHKKIGDADFRHIIELREKQNSNNLLSLVFIYGDGSDNDNIWYIWFPQGQGDKTEKYLIKDQYKNKPVPKQDFNPRKSLLTGHFLYFKQADGKNDIYYTNGDILELHLANGETPLTDTSSHPRVKVFMFNGYVFVGCEDGNDWDYNDRLYWIPYGKDRIKKGKRIPVKPKKTTPQVWTYAWEDNTMEGNDHCDYDMNDCVIEVKEKDGDPSKLEITLVALGATRQLWLGFENKSGKSYRDYKPVFGDKELHEVLGVPSTTMVNTGNSTRTVAPITVVVDKPAGFDFQTCSFVLGAKVKKEMQGLYENDYYMLHVSTSGTDPHGIVIPGQWKWPTETTCIKDAYPDFNTWAKDHTQAKDWYKRPNESKVVNK